MLTHVVMDRGCARAGWFECRITHGRAGPVMCLSSLVWLLVAGFGVFLELEGILSSRGVEPWHGFASY